MKILFQPITPFVINQAFGENQICIHDETLQIISCDGNNPPTGFRSLYGKEGHKGIDLRAYSGQPVYCAQRGIVYQIDTSKRSGLDVRVESEEKGIKIRHIYEHLLGYQPDVGDRIGVGDLIGWADNTGYSSGDHLHFQTELWTGGKWVKVDPMEYMEPIYALMWAGFYRRATETLARIADTIADLLRKRSSK